MAKIIFITGASRGFGRIWAEAFLQRGDRVVATARDVKMLEPLTKQYGDAVLALPLDVNNRAAAFATVKQAADHFGRIDVLINNAGFGLFGAVEETNEQDAREQFETNVFGLLWVTQAVLPVMRAQGSGHILQLSSALGVATLPLLGLYNASKFAVEGLSETLAAEVKEFGIHVTIVEPNGFSTDWGGVSAVHSPKLEAYDPLRSALQANRGSERYGDPLATSAAILQLVDADQPPLRLFLGKVALPWITQVYEQRLATWRDWNEVSVAAHGN